MAKKLILIIIFLSLILACWGLLSSSPSSPEKPTTFVPRLVQKKKPFHPPPLTLEAVFDPAPPKTATLSAEKITTLVVTGDVGLVRSVNFQMAQRDDFTYPFTKTAEVLKAADLTLINLEGPLIKNCPLTNTGMIFCGDPRGTEGLVSAGVDLANLANNHALDQGEKGLSQTIAALNQAKIAPVSPGEVVVRELKGQKFAFLGYEDVNRRIDEEKVKIRVQEAKIAADVVIVSFHWGTEYASYPDKRQQELAYLAIDNGADLIIGNHPHWTQPVEIYQSKLIVYAHGNFIFDQMWSPKTKEGMIGQYVFYEDRLLGVAFSPVLIDDSYQPNFLRDREKKIFLEDLKQKSDLLSKQERPSLDQ